MKRIIACILGILLLGNVCLAEENPTAALIAQIRGEYDWMRAENVAYTGGHLYCSLLERTDVTAETIEYGETYLETAAVGADVIAVMGAFETTHSVEAFMDCEFMPEGDIERPEHYADIAGETYNQYRFTTRFADAVYIVNAIEFSVDGQIYLFLTALRDADDAEYTETEFTEMLDEWIGSMRVIPAE